MSTVKVSKAGKNKVKLSSDNKFMADIIGDYELDGRSLRKVKREGDKAWDIFWEPDRREFLNKRSHYTNYRMRRVTPTK